MNDAITKIFGVFARPRSYATAFYCLIAFPLGTLYFIFLAVGLSLGLGLVLLWIGFLVLAFVLVASWGLAAFERQQAIVLLAAKIPPMRSPNQTYEDFGQQLLSPAMLAIAEAVDGYVASKYAEVHQTVGTAGAPPSTLAEVAAVDQALNEARVPLGGRVTVMNPQAKADLFAIPSFAEADKRGDDGTALREASMGRFMGFDHFMNQNVKSHTAGSLTGTIAVSGAHAAGVTSVTLATDAGEAIDLVAGDVVTFAGDPQSYVVGAAVSVGASATGAVAIAPALQLALAGGEVVSLALGDHVANLAFHPNAIVLAAVPLALPQGAGRAEFVQSRGLGIRVVWDYDKDAKSDVISLDILAGAKVQDPRLITRVLG